MIKHLYESTGWKIWFSEWGIWYGSNGKAIFTGANRKDILSQIAVYNQTPKQEVPEQYQVKFKDGIYKGSNQ